MHRSALLTFMAVVTICLVALAFSRPGAGATEWLGTVVYSLAAGFGLEYLGTAWAGAGTGLDNARG